jgi:site-specific recombinase XerD
MKILEVLKEQNKETSRQRLIELTGISDKNLNRELKRLFGNNEVLFRKDGQIVYYTINEVKDELITVSTQTTIEKSSEITKYVDKKFYIPKRTLILKMIEKEDLSAAGIKKRLSDSKIKCSTTNMGRTLYVYLSTGQIKIYKRGREVIYTRGDNPLPKATLRGKAVNKTDTLIHSIPLLEGFLEQRKTEERSSKRSVEMYAYNIVKFFVFLGLDQFHNARSVEMIMPSDIRAYMKYLSEDPQNPQEISHRVSIRTLNQILSTISSFFNYCVEQDRIKINPMTNVKRPRIKTKSKTVIVGQDNYKKLVKILKKKKEFLWECVLALMLSTGARVSEIGNFFMDEPTDAIKQRAIDDKVPFGYPIWDKNQIYVYGKNQEHRLIDVDIALTNMLRTYITQYRVPMDPECPSLFLNEHGQPLVTERIQKKMKKLREEAGIKEHITSHSFRHNYATELDAKGIPITEIQKDLDHVSTDTTSIYIHRRKSSEESKEQHIAAFEGYHQEAIQ